MSFVPKNLHLKGLSQCILRYVYFTTKEKLEKKGDKEYHLRFKTENGIWRFYHFPLRFIFYFWTPGRQEMEMVF